MKKDGIEYLFPGHYRGNNPETLHQVEKDILFQARKKVKKSTGNAMFGFNYSISKLIARISYGEQSVK